MKRQKLLIALLGFAVFFLLSSSKLLAQDTLEPYCLYGVIDRSGQIDLSLIFLADTEPELSAYFPVTITASFNGTTLGSQSFGQAEMDCGVEPDLNNAAYCFNDPDGDNVGFLIDFADFGITPELNGQSVDFSFSSPGGIPPDGNCNESESLTVVLDPTQYPACTGSYCRTISDPIVNGIVCNDQGITRSCCPPGLEYSPGNQRCVEPDNLISSPDPDDTTDGVTQAFLNEINPLRSTNPVLYRDENLDTPAGIVSRFLNYLAFPLAAMILFIMILWGGFEMVAQSATKKSIEEGRKRVTSAVAGFILLFLVYWIAQIIELVFGISFL